MKWRTFVRQVLQVGDGGSTSMFPGCLVRRDEKRLVAEEWEGDEQHTHEHKPQNNVQRVGPKPVVDIVAFSERQRRHVDHHCPLQNLQDQVEHE